MHLMRWGRAVAVSVVVVALAACGGGGTKTNAAATGSSSNGSQLSAGAGASVASESGATGGSQSSVDSSVVGAVGADGATSAQAGGQPAANTAAPTPPGLKPFAGTYQFHTTGHATLNGSAQNIDTQSPSVVEDLGATDQRTTSSGAQGQQIQVLRYGADKVELVSLELKGPVTKAFVGPVLLSPVPSSVGQTWNWSMQSTDTDPTKKTTLTQSSRVDRTETVVIGGQSIDVFVIETDITFSSAATDLNGTGHLTNWVSPVYKMAVKAHSTLAGTYAAFSFDSDTTSDLLDLRPS
jgi:hypothetical protein